MGTLSERVETAMNEARILVLVAEVLLSFQLESFFQPGFETLARPAQIGKLCALALMLASAALLMLPAPWHRIAEDGRETRRLLRAATASVGAALLPFAMSLTLDLYAVLQRAGLPHAAVAVSAAAFTLMVAAWYGLGWAYRHIHAGEETVVIEQSGPDRQPPLQDRIHETLTELRVVLPGMQALLAFQFIVVFTSAFPALPRPAQYAHLASLALVGISTVLLMTPPAYHRIGMRGRNTEPFERFASQMLLASMGFFAVGVSVDFYVVALKVLHAPAVAAGLALLALAFFEVLWFGYTLFVRSRRPPA
jgi:hypothetical protein